MDEVTEESWLHFGPLLREFRERHGWSVEDMARLTGVTATSLERFEARQKRPSFHVLYCLGTGFKFTPEARIRWHLAAGHRDDSDFQLWVRFNPQLEKHLQQLTAAPRSAPTPVSEDRAAARQRRVDRAREHYMSWARVDRGR